MSWWSSTVIVVVIVAPLGVNSETAKTIPLNAELSADAGRTSLLNNHNMKTMTGGSVEDAADANHD